MTHIPFFLFFSMLLLGCSVKQQDSQPAVSPQVEYPSLQVETSPETLLLRAHDLDTDAAVKVVLGYLWGKDGFPYDPALSKEWAFEINSMLEYSTASV